MFLIIVSFGTPTVSSNPVVINLSGNTQLKQVNQAAFQPVLDYFEGKSYQFTGLQIDLSQGKIQLMIELNT